MKKIFALILVIIIAATFAACGNAQAVAPTESIIIDTTEETTIPATEATEETTAPEEVETTIPAQEEKKTTKRKPSTSTTTPTTGTKPQETKPAETTPTPTEPEETTPTTNSPGSHGCRGEWVLIKKVGPCKREEYMNCDICGTYFERTVPKHVEVEVKELPATCKSGAKRISVCECGMEREKIIGEKLTFNLITKTKNINGIIVKYEACEHCDTLHTSNGATKRIISVQSYTLADNSVWKVVLTPCENNSIDKWELQITNKTNETLWLNGKEIGAGKTKTSSFGRVVSVNASLVSGTEETVVEKTETSVSVITTFVPDGRIKESIKETFNFDKI